MQVAATVATSEASSQLQLRLAHALAMYLSDIARCHSVQQAVLMAHLDDADGDPQLCPQLLGKQHAQSALRPRRGAWRADTDRW